VIREDPSALTIVVGGAPPPGFEPVFTGLALRPGETIAGGLVEGRPALLLPSRVEAALAAAFVLLPVLLAAMAAAMSEIRAEKGALTRKLASQVGLAEVALLSATEEGLEPIAVGDLSLAAMARATHLLLLSPDSEGCPAGSVVEAAALR
jgi:molybdopterin biosynthesis enzyme